jgi:hypothetical protein
MSKTTDSKRIKRIYFQPGDDHLLDYLKKQPNMSKYVIELIRQDYEGKTSIDQDLVESIKNIEQHLRMSMYQQPMQQMLYQPYPQQNFVHQQQQPVEEPEPVVEELVDPNITKVTLPNKGVVQSMFGGFGK